MEVIMTNVVHHHHAHPFEVPARVYWTAGIGLALIALLFVLSATSASNPVVPAMLMEPALPFIPFVPML
jgi:hypothetical protein